MTPSQEFVYLRTYSRWLDKQKRRENYSETVGRYLSFFKDHLGDVVTKTDLERAHKSIINMYAMPSMRAMWAAGPALKQNHMAAYNCSFVCIDNIFAFSEVLFILMCGTGAGFSVEWKYTSKLPEIKPDGGLYTSLEVDDSKDGWAEALYKVLTNLWNGIDVKVDYSKVRPRGARLKTFGGRASGPEPLRDLFEFIKRMFANKRAKKQRYLDPIDCLDILNKIAEIVVVGGVRRSSEISLSDLDDRAIAEAKMGEFWVENPHRSMSNNSAVYEGRPDMLTFLQEWTSLIKSRAGERGIFNRQGAMQQMAASGRRLQYEDIGTNP